MIIQVSRYLAHGNDKNVLITTAAGEECWALIRPLVVLDNITNSIKSKTEIPCV